MIRPLKQAADDLAEIAFAGVGVAGRGKLGREQVSVPMSKSMSKPMSISMSRSAHVLKNEPKPSAARVEAAAVFPVVADARVAVNAGVNTAPHAAPIGAACCGHTGPLGLRERHRPPLFFLVPKTAKPASSAVRRCTRTREAPDLGFARFWVRERATPRFRALIIKPPSPEQQRNPGPFGFRCGVCASSLPVSSAVDILLWPIYPSSSHAAWRDIWAVLWRAKRVHGPL